MKVHKLPSHGAPTTKCGVRIPTHLAPTPIAIVWVEPDGAEATEPCAKCDPAPSTPSAPRYRRLVAYSVRRAGGVTTWVRAGTAIENRDGSLNVSLDVLPIDGKLHLRPDDGSKPTEG